MLLALWMERGEVGWLFCILVGEDIAAEATDGCLKVLSPTARRHLSTVHRALGVLPAHRAEEGDITKQPEPREATDLALSGE